MKKTQKKFAQTCYFCKGRIIRGEVGNKYIYPVPAKYGLRTHEGKYACPKCARRIFAEQRAEGQLELT